MLQLFADRNELPSPAEADPHQLGQIFDHFRRFRASLNRTLPVDTLQRIIQKVRVNLLIQHLQLRFLLLNFHLIFVFNQHVQAARHVVQGRHQNANLIASAFAWRPRHELARLIRT
ncbi:hypothetical protein D3C84_993480 [compost metagenome]